MDKCKCGSEEFVVMMGSVGAELIDGELKYDVSEAEIDLIVCSECDEPIE